MAEPLLWAASVLTSRTFLRPLGGLQAAPPRAAWTSAGAQRSQKQLTCWSRSQRASGSPSGTPWQGAASPRQPLVSRPRGHQVLPRQARQAVGLDRGFLQSLASGPHDLQTHPGPNRPHHQAQLETTNVLVTSASCPPSGSHNPRALASATVTVLHISYFNQFLAKQTHHTPRGTCARSL